MTNPGGFYRRWILANGVSEAAGLGTTFVLGWTLASWLDGMSGASAIISGTSAIVGAAALAVILGTFLEGVVVGVAQESVLRRRIPQLRRGTWTAATALGAGLAWILGMLPSTVLQLVSSEETAATAPSEPGAIVQFGLAAALGLVAGCVLAAGQWTVLRRLAPHSGRWLVANALAWAIGMPVIFAGMDLVPWNGHPALVVLFLYVVCAVTGTIVGAIHGRFLLRLLDLR